MTLNLLALRPGRAWGSVLAVAAICAAAPAALAAEKGGPGGGAGGGAIVVDSAVVSRTDIPIYLEGLGTVQAFYTATITARIDGALERVEFTEGQTVQKGAVLAQIDPRPAQAALDQALAMQARDAANLAGAQRDMDRYQALIPQNLVSRQQLDAQRSLVDQLKAQVQVDRATIDNARTQLDYTRITSPISGRTGLRLVDPGNIVHASDTRGIVVVTQIQPIAIIFTLPEDALPQVNQALAAGAVQVTALSRDGKSALDTGSLALIDNQIDPTTGTMRLKATFPNLHNTLWPGQFVNTRVLVQRQIGALTVPNSAIEHGPNGPFTYVIKADSTVEARALTLGAQSGELTVVSTGLAPGEQVVTSNQYRLQPGAHVHSTALMAQPGKAAAPDEVARRRAP
ncbi:MAG TPA: efflux RND transporter periplasmic adaptor subunit [Steroidobacteraceae bacterium]|nr:efflux RND transporter periplasmic adaptor subunit [Steroidobacteraceae bacterium]